MDTFEPERNHYERMIELLSKNLNLYEEQAAGFGDLYVPPFLKRQIQDTRAELDRAKQSLQNITTTEQKEINLSKVNRQNNLPSRTLLLGREQEVSAISDLLTENRIVVIDGISGIGKTPVAIEVAHRQWESGTFDAAIWLWLADMVPALTLDSFCSFIARSLDLNLTTELSVNERPEVLRQYLQGRRVLIILDSYNKVHDPELGRFIESLPSTNRVLITSSIRVSLDLDSCSYTLHALNLEQSIELIYAEAGRLGLKAITSLPEKKLHDLAVATSGHPYAIKLCLGQMRQSGLTIEALIRQLDHANNAMFEHIYLSAWQSLKEGSQNILLALMLFAEPCTRQALEAVCDLSDIQIDESLAHLVKVSLVSTNEEVVESRIRYKILALTQYYIHSVSSHPQIGILQKKERYMRFFLQLCEDNQNQWVTTLAEDHENIDVAMMLCIENKWLDEYIRFSRALYNYYRDAGYWEEAIESHKTAIEYARQLNQLRSLGWLCNEIASIYIRKGGPQELTLAEEYLQKAEEVFTQTEDKAGLCGTKGRQARVYNKIGQTEKAIQVGEMALSLAIEINARSRIADIQHELGDVLLAAKRIDEAEKYYRSSKNIYESLGNELRVVGRLNDLGQVMLASQAYNQAYQFFTDAINMARRLHKNDTLVRALIGLAAVEESKGLPIEAFSIVNESLVIAENLRASVELKQAQDLHDKILQQLQLQHCIVMDFDNTLADSFPLHIDTWQKACERFHIKLKSEVIEQVLLNGLPSERAAVMLGIPKEMISQVVGLKRALFQDMSLSGLKLFNHVPDVLQQLHARGYVLTVGTTNSEVMIREIFRRHNLDHLFAAIVGQESVKNNKPAPDILYFINRRIGIPLSQFKVVGDSKSDQQMAQNAGVPFILAVMGNQADPMIVTGNFPVIHDFRELLDIFPEIGPH